MKTILLAALAMTLSITAQTQANNSSLLPPRAKELRHPTVAGGKTDANLVSGNYRGTATKAEESGIRTVPGVRPQLTAPESQPLYTGRNPIRELRGGEKEFQIAPLAKPERR